MQNVFAVMRQHGDPSSMDLACKESKTRGFFDSEQTRFLAVLQTKFSDSHDHQICEGVEVQYMQCNTLMTMVPH